MVTFYTKADQWCFDHDHEIVHAQKISIFEVLCYINWFNSLILLPILIDFKKLNDSCQMLAYNVHASLILMN